MRRDYLAGLLVCLVAVFTGYYATTYTVGSLRSIGPGFFPFFLSIALFGVGVLIAVNAPRTEAADGHSVLDHFAPDASKYPDFRGGLAIAAGTVAFIVVTQTLGFLAGTFACVFLSAIGDRSATWLGSLVLAVVMTVVGAGVFIYFLKINLPLVQFQAFSL